MVWKIRFRKFTFNNWQTVESFSHCGIIQRKERQLNRKRLAKFAVPYSISYTKEYKHGNEKTVDSQF